MSHLTTWICLWCKLPKKTIQGSSFRYRIVKGQVEKRRKCVDCITEAAEKDAAKSALQP